MSNYINVGARFSDGSHVPTKKALRDRMKSDPSAVTFYPTSRFGSQRDIRGDEIPSDGSVLSVVGPNPENDRRWYASVEKTARGVRVS